MTEVPFRIRATRAAPPANAASAGPRRATYSAALTQFDELIAAAESAGPASRPLPLYYALAQAGRALVAAYGGDRWRLRSHGLSAPNLDGDCTQVVIRRQERKRSKDGTLDSFTGVASATAGQPFKEPVPIGALWASLPEVAELLPSNKWSKPLLLVPAAPSGKLVAWDRASATIVGFDGPPEDLVTHLERNFPTATGVRLRQPPGVPHVEQLTEFGFGIGVWWPTDDHTVMGHIDALQRVAGTGIAFEERPMRPSVGRVALSPLLTWWAILYGLSMLARYEPGGWATALDLDTSPLAAPLGRLLDVGVDRVPELVLDGLIR